MGAHRKLGWIGAAVVALLPILPAAAQDERPTGYPRSANEGDTHPVSISAVYTADLRADADGGLARGVRYLDDLDLQLAIDADRLVGWHGARLFAYALYNNGTRLSPTLVGDLQGISNVETDTRALRLFEAWIEQDVGADGSLKVGLYNLNAEFDTTQSGGLFLLSSHGIGPELGRSGRNGPSIFPVTSLAIRYERRLGLNWLARAAVLDGVPGDPDHPAATAIKLSKHDGALLIGELDYLRGGTKAAIGSWRYTSHFDPIGEAGATGRGYGGLYLFAEQRLTGSRDDPPAGLAGWVRVGIADPRFDPIARYGGGGLVYSGLGSGRQDDAIGLSLAVADLGPRERRMRAVDGRPAAPREVVVEAAYLATLAPWFRLQPDVQYVIDPGGARRVPDALVLGLRVKLGR